MGSVQRTSSARAAGALNPGPHARAESPGRPHPDQLHRNRNRWAQSPGVVTFETPRGIQMCVWVGGGKWALLSNGDEASVMQDDEVLEIRYAP